MNKKHLSHTTIQALLNDPDLLISMHQDNSEIGRLQFSAANDGDVVSLADVVDVDGDAGIRSNAVLFHQSYQFGLSQVVWGTCMFLYHLNLTTCNIDTPLRERSKYAKSDQKNFIPINVHVVFMKTPSFLN